MNSDKNPLISVVIPSYNHSRYIGKTIDSILNQTVTDLELIIIDDGSADDSLAVIQSKLAEFEGKNVRLISRANKGLCYTLNEGLRLAKGKYFAYIGSDDIWDLRKLEKQVEAIESSAKNTMASYTDTFIIDGEGDIIDRYGRQYNYRGGDIYRDLIRMRFQPPSPTNLFLRSAIISVGGFNENQLIEDKDLWVRMSRLYNIVYVDEPLAYYRVHGNNVSIVYPERMYKYYWQILENAAKKDPSLALSKHLISSEITALQAGTYYEILDLSKARHYALKTLLRNPFNRIAWRTLLFSLLGKKIINSLRGKRREQIKQNTYITK